MGGSSYSSCNHTAHLVLNLNLCPELNFCSPGRAQSSISLAPVELKVTAPKLFKVNSLAQIVLAFTLLSRARVNLPDGSLPSPISLSWLSALDSPPPLLSRKSLEVLSSSRFASISLDFTSSRGTAAVVVLLAGAWLTWPLRFFTLELESCQATLSRLLTWIAFAWTTIQVASVTFKQIATIHLRFVGAEMEF